MSCVNPGVPLRTQMLQSDLYPIKKLGEGTDGSVNLYGNRRDSSNLVAVKGPGTGREWGRRQLRRELYIMKTLTRCAQIVNVLGWDEFWLPVGPAIFYEYCELGDVIQYRKKLMKCYPTVPEETIWKLFADVAKGLDHLHNKMGMMHMDLKTENILVARPAGCKYGTIPILPDFKITDLARTTKYEHEKKYMCQGTWQFAPPFDEQFRVTPLSDVWSLGATIQAFALNMMPTMGKEGFEGFWKEHHKHLIEKTKYHPPNRQDYWNRYRPVIFRPLNLTAEQQMYVFNWKDKFMTVPQYCNALNRWYSLCMQDERSRINSADLVRWMVPNAEMHIRILSAKREVERRNRIQREYQKAMAEVARLTKLTDQVPASGQRFYTNPSGEPRIVGPEGFSFDINSKEAHLYPERQESQKEREDSLWKEKRR
ncbi:kinase-like domain-containing protein [Clohesyomyces aquaticus]|uniref:Kinase-like domain-containing protein n=1 Tax=Clohesyomyces aquaticus TaxID=1231657 RepID=A0A1Y2A8F4_9PLEO|nr:kinase-like domain-containing protein [Clohesyomyces aquaticus]